MLVVMAMGIFEYIPLTHMLDLYLLNNTYMVIQNKLTSTSRENWTGEWSDRPHLIQCTTAKVVLVMQYLR